jgi:predicted ATPase
MKNLIKRFNESLESDVEDYLEHLKDDGFSIEVSDDFFRIYKPISGSVYKYDNLKEFSYNTISDDIKRFINLIDGSYSINYIYVIKYLSNLQRLFPGNKIGNTRVIVSDILNDDLGEIKSLVIGVK